MKQKLPYLLLVFSLFFGFNTIQAQCTPDPDCTEMICPAELSTAYESEAYDETITINVPAEYEGFTVHHIDVLTINNFPAGLSYICQDNDCSFYPEIPKCISITGTPEAGTTGTYGLEIVLEAFINVGGNPVSVGEIQQYLNMVVELESGIYTYSISEGMGIQVNPNPFQNSINITTNSISNNNLHIFDISGKEVIYIESFKQENLDISYLQSGVYFLQIENGKNTETVKIMKQ